MKNVFFQTGFWGGAALLLLSGCGAEKPAGSAPTAEPPALARVGDRALREADFPQELARWRSSRRPVTGAEEIVREWVERESLLRRAQAAGLEDDPAIRREIEALLVSRLLERELNPSLESVEISPELVREEYEASLARFTQSARVRLAMIYQQVGKKAGEGPRAEARARLEEIRPRALAHPASGGRGPAASGFGALAAEASDDQASRYRGGDLGWLEPGRFDYRWPRAVLEAGYALKPGEVSEVVETDGGYYLVMKAEERPSFVQPFEQVEATLRQGILVRKRAALNADYREKAVREAGAVIDMAAVAGLPTASVVPELARRSETVPPSMPGTGQPE